MSAIMRKTCKLGIKTIVLCAAFGIYAIAAQIESTDGNAGDGRFRELEEKAASVNDAANVELFKSNRGVTVADIRELTRRSTDIIVGRPLAIKSSFRKGSGLDDVHTMHLILVQTVLKGDVKAGSSVHLRMPGGIFIDDKDNVVNRLASDVRPPREGASYFIFMKKRNGDEKEAYIPSLGIQSLFEIDFDTNTVIPCDTLKSSPVVQKYLRAPATAFWEEISFEVSSEVRRR